jgi:tetratricopeptide (TPR) repeat protein
VELNKFNDALPDLNQTIELAPNYSNAYTWRGHAYSELNMKEKAIADYEKALELGDHEVQGYIVELKNK